MGITKPKDLSPLHPKLIAALPAPIGQGKLRVAFSGGLDSSVLLHALRATPGLQAIHVNHGMQAQAQAWERHCVAQCQEWGVPLDIRKVEPNVKQGGREAAARSVRYAAMAELMQPNDVLLTAQHADDQAETFLLQALRGAGVRGLAAMPQLAEFGPGQIARPLLGISRKEIAEYAETYKLQWVEDPSNADSTLARSYLRQQVSPGLARQWPGFAQRLSRSAEWCAQASTLNAELARIDLEMCRGPVPGCLCLQKMTSLKVVRQDNLIRYWLDDLCLQAPDHRHIQQIRNLINISRPDTQPLVAWENVQLRRFAHWIFAMPKLSEVPENYSIEWDMRQKLVLPQGCGRLEPIGQNEGKIVTVRFRRGGERIKLNGREHGTRLKQVLQAAQVPGWVRVRAPLIYAGDELIAVADYWKNTRAPAINWIDPPPGADLARVVGSGGFS